MATAHAPSFDDVEAHLNAADLSALQPGGKHHPAAAAAPAAASPCAAYKVVRPILVVVANTPLIPQRWRDAVKAFVGVMDVICP